MLTQIKGIPKMSDEQPRAEEPDIALHHVILPPERRYHRSVSRSGAELVAESSCSKSALLPFIDRELGSEGA